MAILDLEKSVWIDALGDKLDVVPDVLILEGTWWRQAACEARLQRLSGVIELPFPDMFVGTFDDARIAYCCAYGAARAVEPAHVFAQLGTPLLIQIGTCGVMVEDIDPGTVAVPRTASARDGVSVHYGAGEVVDFDRHWADRAEVALRARDIPVRQTRHVTWPSLFAQSDALCRDWAEDGLETVDMEASAVAAVAHRFGGSSLALLATWDLLAEGHTFLDLLPETKMQALNRANAAIYDVALELAKEVVQLRTA